MWHTVKNNGCEIINNPFEIFEFSTDTDRETFHLFGELMTESNYYYYMIVIGVNLVVSVIVIISATLIS